MESEVWRWQGATFAKAELKSVSVGPDGSCTLVGYTFGDWDSENAGSRDMTAVKLDSDGTVQWKWQGGTADMEQLKAVTVGGDGSVVMVGNAGEGPYNFAAVKLDEDGELLWEWQDGSSAGDSATAVSMTGDDSVIWAGSTYGLWGEDHSGSSDFTASKLDGEGALIWTWQNGTSEEEAIWAAVVGDDDSVVLAGYTYGNWTEAQGGEDDADFAAVKLDADGNELWRWQDGTTVADVFYGATSGQDGSTVLAGSTEGSWKGGHAGGTNDFAAVKLDADGGEVWRWQDGTKEDDVIKGVAAGDDGSVVLAGHTKGVWSGQSDGSNDFAAVRLDANGIEIWRWQGGSAKSASDYAEAVGVGPDGSAVLAGKTGGSWDGVKEAYAYDYAAVMLDMDASVTPSPTLGLLSSVDALPPTQTPMSPYTTRISTHGPSSPASSLRAPTTPTPTSQPPVSSPTSPPSPTPRALYPTLRPTRGPSPLAPAVAAPTSSAPASQPPASLPTSPPTPTPTSLATSNTPTPGLASRAPISVTPAAPTLPIPTSSPLVSSSLPTPAPTPTGLYGTRNPTHEPSSFAPSLPAPTSPALTAQPSILTRPSPPTATPTVEHTRGMDPPGLTAVFPTLVATTSMPSASTRSSRSTATPTSLHTRRTPTPGLASVSPTLAATTSRSSLSATIVGLVCAIATLALGFAVVCLRRKRKAKQNFTEIEDREDVSITAAQPDDVSSTNGSTPSEDNPPSPSGRCDVARAVLEMAHHLARQSQFPGVCEAATLVSTLVNLISNDRGSIAESESRLKRCRLLVMMLERAATVLGKIDSIGDDDSSREMKRMLIKNVQDAIEDMVGLIKTYKSKRRITQVVVSTLFKRRMEETEEVINQTFSDLMRWLHIDTALKQKEGRPILVKDRRRLTRARRRQKSSKDCATVGPRTHLPQDAAEAQSIASDRRLRRQRNLDQIEIPADHVLISEDVLGKGGFGTVYIADYNGRNAAAKVIEVDRDHEGRVVEVNDASRGGTNRAEPDTNLQRASLLLELQAMIRLRSPYTVNVYGAITSRSDRIVLVMELLTGGDLRALLEHSDERLPEEQARSIIGDVCAGMTFLHSKNTIHGDLKSANVLLDGEGRAKIGDFGTSRWTQYRDSTGLATYKPTRGNTMHMMSFAWAAPEVLDAKGSSYASDVYSFGIVAWEVLSMQVPWADEAAPLDIYKRVVFKGERPTIPADAPTDVAAVVRACWAGAPEERPTASEVMRKLKSRELQV